MRRITFTITKEGQVFVQAEGYQGQECLKSPKVQKILNLLKQEGEIDIMEVRKERQAIVQEEAWW